MRHLRFVRDARQLSQPTSRPTLPPTRLLLALFLLLPAWWAWAGLPPEADFTTSPTTGAYPLAVQFSDQSRNEPATWAWDFDGDGTTDSTERSPRHVYERPGTYSVRLTVTNLLGRSQKALANLIVIPWRKPTVKFNADPPIGPAPLTVHFTDQSTDYPIQWQWDLSGERIYNHEQNPTYTYLKKGIYKVLFAAGNTGGYGQAQQFIRVGNPAVPGWIWQSEPDPTRTHKVIISTGNQSVESYRWTIGQTVVWTGERALIWGGRISERENDLGEETDQGWSYDPRTRQFTRLPRAPIRRSGHTAVWTGREMIVYGGMIDDRAMSNGARYDPASNTWAMMGSCDHITAHVNHVAVWTGSRMIAWGGYINSSGIRNDGCAFDPVTNDWESVPNAPISGRIYYTAVWTGKELIVWGGRDWVTSNYATYYSDGAAYNPQTHTWRLISSKHGLTGRARHSAVWTGREMIVQGGQNSAKALSDGACYNPETDTWRHFDPGAADQRSEASMVWTGREAIVWGGRDGQDLLNSGLHIDPATTQTFGATPQAQAPPARYGHRAIWAGPDYGMLVFGDMHVDNSPTSCTYAIYQPDPGPAPPVADFLVETTETAGTLVARFTDLSRRRPTAWAWDFDGDGQVDSTDPNPVHIYDRPGVWPVCLVARNAYGSDATTGSVRFTGLAPSPDFGATPALGRAPLTVSFTDRSGKDPTTWEWDFDNDGQVDATDPNPTHVYDTPGTYTVRLVAGNDHGSTETVKVGCVRVLAVVEPDFVSEPAAGPAPLTVQFHDRTRNGPDRWAWDLDGDGQTDSNDPDPTFTYTKPGHYAVRLTAGNAIATTTTQRANWIQVAYPPAEGKALPPVIDLNQSLTGAPQPMLRIGIRPEGWGWFTACSPVAYGDLNGDGYDDLVLYGDGTMANTIRVSSVLEIIWGGPGLTTNAVYPLGAPPTGGRRTRIVLGLTNQFSADHPICCDLDGDGLMDLVFNRIRNDASTFAVHVLYGRDDFASAATLDLDALPPGQRHTTILPGFADEYLGRALASGDMNGDGRADLVVGAIYGSTGQRGRVYVLYGRPDWPASVNLAANGAAISPAGETRILSPIDGEPNSEVVDGFGWGVACGDINGDGFDDVVATADALKGQAYVLFGDAGLPGTTVRLAGYGSPVGPRELYIDNSTYRSDGITGLGYSVACGDVDGDGYDDIALGAPRGVDGRTGSVYLVHGAATRPGTMIDVTDPPAAWGGTVVLGHKDEIYYYYDTVSLSLADINGDGLDDLALTDSTGSYPPWTPLNIFYGGARLAGGTIDLGTAPGDVSLRTNTTRSDWPRTMAGGDINGDGFGDLTLTGLSYLMPGNTSPTPCMVALLGNGAARSATAREWVRPGAAFGRRFGGPFAPTMRATLAFTSDGGPVAAARYNLTVRRQAPAVANLKAGGAAGLAPVSWRFETPAPDRVTTATLTFKYLDSEVAGWPEGDVRVIRAGTDGHNYYELPTVLDPRRHMATVTVDALTTFGLARRGAVPPWPVFAPVGAVVIQPVPATAGWMLSDGTSQTRKGSGSTRLDGIAAGTVRLTWTSPAGYDSPTTNPAVRRLPAGGRVTFNEVFVPSPAGKARDRTRVLRYLLGLTGSPAGLDFNQDGRVDAADVLRLSTPAPAH